MIQFSAIGHLQNPYGTEAEEWGVPNKKFKDLIHCCLYHLILDPFMDKQKLIYFQEDKKQCKCNELKF